MKSPYIALLLAAFLMANCSGSSGDSGENEDTNIVTPDWYVPPKDTGDDPDTQVVDDLMGDLDVVGSDMFWDGDTVVEDVVEPPDTDTSSEVDTIVPPEVVPQDTKQPIEYGYETYGALTISPKGLLVNSQFVQLRFAQVDYWKYGADRWDYLLDMVADAGFNGVYTSVCWHRHERTAGAFDFLTGNLDLAAFLDKASQRGLYVYLMVGPWVDREAGGCLPGWMLSDDNNIASPVADGKIAVRVGDADFLQYVGLYFDQVNLIVGSRQISSFPEGNVVFYGLEPKYDLFMFLKEGRSKMDQEMLGLQSSPVNAALYFAKLKELINFDGINLPLVSTISGDFENGGKSIVGLGEVPGVHPAFELDGWHEYESLELKLTSLRKELRSQLLHGTTYAATPGIAVGLAPTAAHLGRAIMAGADVVVLRDFAAAVLPLDALTVGLTAEDAGIFAGLDGELGVTLEPLVRDAPSPLSASGLPRSSYFQLRTLNSFLDYFDAGFAGKDQPMRTGPNQSGLSMEIEASHPAVGAIEDKWYWPQPGPSGGLHELMKDQFAQWYQYPSEATGRATYLFNSQDGTTMVQLLNLDRTADGENLHERQDLITKLIVNGKEIPRHSNIVVPASDDTATGASWLGWGGKFIVLNHPLGVGLPFIEYCTANLLAVRDFNNRTLIVAHGKPLVKAEGVFFTEPGEISFSGFSGIPNIVKNTLPGGGVHTDAGGKIAVQFQHDSTGFMVVSLGAGKLIQLMVTTTAVAQTAYFGKDLDASDIAIFGLDRVESLNASFDGVTIQGRRLASDTGVLSILPPNPPYRVVFNGDDLKCDYDEDSLFLDCQLDPQPYPEGEPIQGSVYMKTATYSSIADAGTGVAPDAFVEFGGEPVSLADAGVAAYGGVAWYVADVEMGPVPPVQQGLVLAEGGADLVSVYVNGTYVGSSTSLGNRPMSAMDVSMQLPEAGFKIPPGLLVEGTNNIAFRVLAWGRSFVDMVDVYSMAPLLPLELDQFASSFPHFSVAGLNAPVGKGIWGEVRVIVGGMSNVVTGPWTISAGDAQGVAGNKGMLQGWHNFGAGETVPTGQGFSTTGAIADESPLSLADGQTTWLTRNFSTHTVLDGGMELALEGQGFVALVFVNGTAVGLWAADEVSLQQGLHSRLLQGAGSRQILADQGYHNYAYGEQRIPLPGHLLNKGDQVNRVTAMLLDISPPLEADLVLLDGQTVPGVGEVSRFDVTWNSEQTRTLAHPDHGLPLYWASSTLELLPEPPPEEEQ